MPPGMQGILGGLGCLVHHFGAAVSFRKDVKRLKLFQFRVQQGGFRFLVFRFPHLVFDSLISAQCSPYEMEEESDGFAFILSPIGGGAGV